MSYITIKITKDQLEAVRHALEMDQAFEVFGDGREKHQAFLQRIIVKLAKS